MFTSAARFNGKAIGALEVLHVSCCELCNAILMASTTEELDRWEIAHRNSCKDVGRLIRSGEERRKINIAPPPGSQLRSGVDRRRRVHTEQ